MPKPSQRRSLQACLESSTVAVALAACSTASLAPPADVPAALRAPAGQTLFLETFATGVQIYECQPKKDQPASFEWAFKAPEATLADRAGHVIGKHYAGPTWESSDGSVVVGEVKARDVGPDPKAIPWLLLAAKSTRGNGVLSATVSVQRLQTVGGIAPADPCGPANATQQARVPYTAVYEFYAAPR